MKSLFKIKILIIVILAFYGCREITITTEVHKDGSFTRIITITGDSSHVLKKDLPYPVDSTWAMVFEPDTAEDSDYRVIYSKTFKKDKKLQNEIQNDTSWYKNLDRTIEVKKRLGIFYSYLTYREVYKRINPFNKLDYRDYLSQNDLDWINGNKLPVTTQDSVNFENAEEKMDDFLMESIMFEFLEELQAGIQRSSNPVLQQVNLADYEDSVKVAIEKWEYEHANEIIAYYRDWSGIKEFMELYELEPPLFDTLNQKFYYLYDALGMEDYQSVIKMPGLITSTNSVSLTGNTVSWHVTLTPMLLEDHEMIVESRVINVWGFILVGLLLLSLLGLIIYKTIVNRKNNIN